MEFRQLEYFVAVAEETNFTRAAERVHISQSGVSAQIRQLEHDLGATLIDRSGRTASLTAAGAAALGHARAALASVGAVRQAVDKANGLIRGRLVVGMVTACTVNPLFDALAAFHLAHPGVEISLIEDNSDLLIQRVRTGAADLALIGAAGAPPAGLGALPIVSERLVAAVPPGHPLAGQPRATPPAGSRPRRHRYTRRARPHLDNDTQPRAARTPGAQSPGLHQSTAQPGAVRRQASGPIGIHEHSAHVVGLVGR
jgi:DNA-binding transcriptional LysR family regulator